MKINRLTDRQHQNGLTVTVFLLLFFFCMSPLLADKTDVVVLENGDKITGEIKKLERGRLEYNTDDMGWIYIDWTKVVKISSRNQFDVEMGNGQRHIGSIQETQESRKMIVATGTGLFTLDTLSVVKITPLESLFKERFKGYIDFGFSLEKANSLTNWILGTEITYRTAKWAAKAEGLSYLKKEKEVDSITRHSLNLTFGRLMKSRWQASLLTMLTHNSELGLELRTTLGGGMGRHVIQTNHMLLLLMGGAVGTREQFTGTEESQYNFELLGGVDFQAFRFDHPKLDSTLGLIVYPSITDFGRLRAEFNGRVRYELFRDFFITLHVFNHFDSRPGSEDVSKNDYGLDATLTYSFR